MKGRDKYIESIDSEENQQLWQLEIYFILLRIKWSVLHCLLC